MVNAKTVRPSLRRVTSAHQTEEIDIVKTVMKDCLKRKLNLSNDLNKKNNLGIQPKISYFRIILGVTTMVIFAIISTLGSIGLDTMQKAQPQHHLLYDGLWTMMVIVPPYILGLVLWIIGIFDILKYRINKWRKRSV